MQSVSAGFPAYSGYPSQSMRPVKNVQPVHQIQASRLTFKSSEPDMEQNASSKPKSEEQAPRSRWNVFKDIAKRYATKGGLLGDVLAGTVLGALFAIGSPVMVVTIPSTLAVLFGITLVRWSILLYQDPNGEVINSMYRGWDKVDKMMTTLQRQTSIPPRSDSAEHIVGNTD